MIQAVTSTAAAVAGCPRWEGWAPGWRKFQELQRIADAELAAVVVAYRVESTLDARGGWKVEGEHLNEARARAMAESVRRSGFLARVTRTSEEVLSW